MVVAIIYHKCVKTKLHGISLISIAILLISDFKISNDFRKSALDLKTAGDPRPLIIAIHRFYIRKYSSYVATYLL